VAGPGGGTASYIGISKLVPPSHPWPDPPPALAPFPLPKVPLKVSKNWTFKTGAGDTPTLPVVALQLFAMPVYDEFLRLLENANPPCARQLPGTRPLRSDRGRRKDRQRRA